MKTFVTEVKYYQVRETSGKLCIILRMMDNYADVFYTRQIFVFKAFFGYLSNFGNEAANVWPSVRSPSKFSS